MRHRSTKRISFRPLLETLEDRLAPAVVNNVIMPAASGPGLGNYAFQAWGTPDPNNDNVFDKDNFISQDETFANNGPIDVVYNLNNSAGITEYYMEFGAFNRTNTNWTSMVAQLGFGTGAQFAPAPVLGYGGLNMDYYDQVEQPSTMPARWGTITKDYSDVSYSGAILNNQGQAVAGTGVQVSGANGDTWYWFSIDVPDFDPAQMPAAARTANGYTITVRLTPTAGAAAGADAGLATPTVAVSDPGGIFNGSADTATATVAGVDGTLALSLEGVTPTLAYYDANGTALANAPTQAGLYAAMASFAGSTDYAAANSEPAVFAISRATPTINVNDNGGTYNASPFPAAASVAGVVPGVDDSPTASREGVIPSVTYFAGGSASGIPLLGAPSQPGTYTVVASFPGSQDYAVAQSNPDTFTISSANEAPVVSISNPGSQTSNAGDTVSVLLLASASNGDPVTIVATGLPPELSISNGAITGAIASSAGSGTPFTVTLTATDATAGVSPTQTFSWTVNVQAITFINPGSQTNSEGDTVYLPLTVYAWASNGDAITFAASGLPPGLTISSNGVISGTVAASASYTVIITATDVAADICATQSFTWTVA